MTLTKHLESYECVCGGTDGSPIVVISPGGALLLVAGGECVRLAVCTATLVLNLMSRAGHACSNSALADALTLLSSLALNKRKHANTQQAQHTTTQLFYVARQFMQQSLLFFRLLNSVMAIGDLYKNINKLILCMKTHKNDRCQALGTYNCIRMWSIFNPL